MTFRSRLSSFLTLLRLGLFPRDHRSVARHSCNAGGRVQSRAMGAAVSAGISVQTSRDQFVGRVVANVPLCREHFRLVLAVDQFPQTEPGQFVQVSCRDLAQDYTCETE